MLMLCIGVAAAFHSGTASAQKYPDGRITMVVGFGAGGMTDVSSRILANKLEKLLKTTIIVENRAGAGGTLAIKSVGQAEADGYTMVSFPTARSPAPTRTGRSTSPTGRSSEATCPRSACCSRPRTRPSTRPRR
jgi:tripartite-type tricarboxylate transporter receptor subunit TctC